MKKFDYRRARIIFKLGLYIFHPCLWHDLNSQKRTLYSTLNPSHDLNFFIWDMRVPKSTFTWWWTGPDGEQVIFLFFCPRTPFFRAWHPSTRKIERKMTKLDVIRTLVAISIYCHFRPRWPQSRSEAAPDELLLPWTKPLVMFLSTWWHASQSAKSWCWKVKELRRNYKESAWLIEKKEGIAYLFYLQSHICKGKKKDPNKKTWNQVFGMPHCK